VFGAWGMGHGAWAFGHESGSELSADPKGTTTSNGQKERAGRRWHCVWNYVEN